MKLEWSPQQEEALRRVGKWRRGGGRQCFVLGGYAGTGKTTLAGHLAGEVGEGVYFASFTGKAAHVLRKKTGLPASTIHSLIYNPRDKCDARLRQLEAELSELRRRDPEHPGVPVLEKKVRLERENVSRPDFRLNLDSPLREARLVVVDEYSMVDRRVGADLLSFRCPVLALGDPGQLPPVRGERFFAEPDYVLTEIHRQAEGNPIIRMSRDVREGRALAPGRYGGSSVLRRSEVSETDLDELMLAADQVLVGTNRTRRGFNQRIRKLLGRTGQCPEVGDKLVCLRNDRDAGLLNGQTWYVERVSVRGKHLVSLGLRGEEGEHVGCLAYRSPFESGADPNPLPLASRREAQEFDHGYAMTVHKSQGSQWGSVVLFDEWWWDGRRQWLYTGITRASEDVTVIVN